MHARRSPCERGQREPRPRWAGTLREDVPLRALERRQRGEPAAGEEPDGASNPPPDARLQQHTAGKEIPRTRRFVLERAPELRAGPIERGDAEAPPVLGREIDAAELQVARHVLQEIHELQAGADVVALGNDVGLAVEAQQAEDEPADGVRRVAAVLAQVVPGLVLRDPLIHAVRLDQAEEWLARQRELANRRLERLHHRPRRFAGVTSFELVLEVVEGGEPVSLQLVAEDVDEAREAVDGPEMRSQPP